MNASVRIWAKRIGWLAVIWAASVLALGIVAGLIRLVLVGR